MQKNGKENYKLVKLVKWREDGYIMMCAVIDAVSRQKLITRLCLSFCTFPCNLLHKQARKKSEINIKAQLNGDAVGNAKGANTV